MISWLLVQLCTAIAQDCPVEGTQVVETCVPNCVPIIGDRYNFGELQIKPHSWVSIPAIVAEMMSSYKICPVLEGNNTNWSLTIMDGVNAYCADQANPLLCANGSVLCVRGDLPRNGPQSIFLYYGNSSVEIRYGESCTVVHGIIILYISAETGVYAVNSSVTIHEGDSVRLKWEIYHPEYVPIPKYELFRQFEGQDDFVTVTENAVCMDICIVMGSLVSQRRCYVYDLQYALQSARYRLVARRSDSEDYIGNDTVSVQGKSLSVALVLLQSRYSYTRTLHRYT